MYMLRHFNPPEFAKKVVNCVGTDKTKKYFPILSDWIDLHKKMKINVAWHTVTPHSGTDLL